MAEDGRPQNDVPDNAQNEVEHSVFTSEELDRAIREYNEERQARGVESDIPQLMLIDLCSDSTSPLQTSNSSANSPSFALL